MRILITGSSGFIGTNAVKYFRRLGHSIRRADIKTGQDLRDIRTCLKLTKNIDFVIHLAADVGGSQYINEKKVGKKIYLNNLVMDTNIFSACKVNKVKKIFYASSSCVYPIKKPENIYGLEKLQAERILRHKRIPYIIGRLQNIYGKYDRRIGKKGMVIPSLIYKTKKNKIVEVLGDGTQKRSFLYVNDLCDQIKILLKTKKRITVDLGGKVYTINQVLSSIMKNTKFGREIRRRRIPKDKRKRFPKPYFKPKTKLDDGIRDVYKWFR